MPFDRKLFLEHINASDPVSCLIRGHLYVEQALNELISYAVPNSKGLQADNFAFSEKLRIANGLELIADSELPAFSFLNKMRNKAAHKLQVTFDANDERKLLSCLNDFQKFLLGSDATGHNVRAAIAVLVISLEKRLERLKEQAAEMARLHEEVRQVLAESKVPEKGVVLQMCRPFFNQSPLSRSEQTL